MESYTGDTYRGKVCCLERRWFEGVKDRRKVICVDRRHKSKESLMFGQESKIEGKFITSTSFSFENSPVIRLSIALRPSDSARLSSIISCEQWSLHMFSHYRRHNHHSHYHRHNHQSLSLA